MDTKKKKKIRLNHFGVFDFDSQWANVNRNKNQETTALWKYLNPYLVTDFLKNERFVLL